MKEQIPTSPAFNRVDVIRTSLRAFVLGLIGFLPIIGLVPAVLAIWCDRRIRSRYGTEWNPAASYLRCGVILAVLGILGTALILSSTVATLAVYGL